MSVESERRIIAGRISLREGTQLPKLASQNRRVAGSPEAMADRRHDRRLYRKTHSAIIEASTEAARGRPIRAGGCQMVAMRHRERAWVVLSRKRLHL